MSNIDISKTAMEQRKEDDFPQWLARILTIITIGFIIIAFGLLFHLGWNMVL